jgi:uncharacterized protein involved in tolerance to divalent cations
MITVYIYTPEQQLAKEMAEGILKRQLAAHVSIDKDNRTYKIVADEMVEEKMSLIVAQTKALLYNEIEEYIFDNFGKDILIYSLPITQSSAMFYSLMKNNTKKI